MKRKLSNYLINKKLQLRLTYKFLVIAVIFCIIIGVLVYNTIWPTVSGFVPLALIGQLKQEMFYRLLCFSFPLLIVIIACCIILTHKIAGPIFNMEHKIGLLIEGKDPIMVKLRDGDELQEMADKLNTLMLLCHESSDPAKVEELRLRNKINKEERLKKEEQEMTVKTKKRDDLKFVTGNKQTQTKQPQTIPNGIAFT